MNAFTVIIDSREQAPWSFPADVPTGPGTLAAGDYSLSGFEGSVAVERKSLPDLVSCIGPERERFKRELQRLKAYRVRAVIIEGTLQNITGHQYRSATLPASVLGSLASWQVWYEVPFIFAGDAAGAATYCLALLRNYHRQLVEFAAKFTATKTGE